MAVSTLPVQGGIASSPAPAPIPRAIDPSASGGAILALDLGTTTGWAKRHATGKGNAGKDAVIAAMRAKGFNPEDDNEADALAILTWVIDTQGGVR